MAGNFGFFLKGVGQGISTGFEMGWKKKQQKKLEEEQKKIAEGTTLFNNMVKQYGEDGVYSDNDIAMLNTAFLAAGAEVQEYTKGTREAILTMNKNKVEQDFQWLELASSWTDGLDPKNAKEIFDYIRSNITTDKGKNYYAAYEKMYKAKYEAAQNQPEDVWGQAGVLPQDVRPDYLRSKGVNIPQPTTGTPQAPNVSDYNSISTYLSKFINTSPDTFNKIKTGLQKQYPNLDLSNITQEALREPEKAVSDGGVSVEEPRVTSLPQLEEYRDKALNADSWKDAEKIINDYTEAGYDASQLGVTKEAWANTKKSDLDNLVAVLDEITAGTPNVKGNKLYSFEINGKVKEQTGEEWFKQVYESYVALLKLLEDQGIDTSQYKKLKPLSEIKKAGFLKGMFTGGGVERGDLPSIYY